MKLLPNACAVGKNGLHAGLPPLLEIREIRENWKAFFQSGKSQGICHFFSKIREKSGNLDDPIFFYILMRQCVFITGHILITLSVIKNSFILNYRMMFYHDYMYFFVNTHIGWKAEAIYLLFEYVWKKVENSGKVREKSGNFIRKKKWEPCAW